MPRLETIASNTCAHLKIMWPRLTHIHPSNYSTQLFWSCHAAPLVKIDSIQMRTCMPFPRLPGTGGQERQRSLYPSHVDCHWQAQIIQFGDQGLDRADSNPLGFTWLKWGWIGRNDQIPCVGWFNQSR
ncbi:hypothetical protein TNCV_5024981 [Trichonephila clavipes]|nr:hypothetical protein TNCV_5024981 [Trichonephila clavipes]